VSVRFAIRDLAETEAWGRRLGEHLEAGMVVALIGPLGAGKTHLVRAIAEGLGIANSRLITSPTFVLIQEYPARLPIFHFDAYRLSGSREFQELGVDEYYDAQGVCLIEWADRVIEALPAEFLQITIEPRDEQERVFDVATLGVRYQALLPKLADPKLAN